LDNAEKICRDYITRVQNYYEGNETNDLMADPLTILAQVYMS